MQTARHFSGSRELEVPQLYTYWLVCLLIETKKQEINAHFRRGKKPGAGAETPEPEETNQEQERKPPSQGK